MSLFMCGRVVRSAGFIVAALLWVSPLLAAEYKTGVNVQLIKRSTTTGNGQKIVYPVTDNPEVTAMTVEILPGMETGWHTHLVPVYGYVMAGSLTVELEGGKELTFSEKDAIIEVVNSAHNGKNKGTQPVKLVVFYIGAEGKPNVNKTPPPTGHEGSHP